MGEFESKWEPVDLSLHRIKVEGGYLYHTSNGASEALTFVPDVDLTRYQSHLRDAYNKGFEDGRSERKYMAHYTTELESKL